MVSRQRTFKGRQFWTKAQLRRAQNGSDRVDLGLCDVGR
jgi:hypothetical protein